MKTKYKVIRSGKDRFAYHEVDIDENSRFIVQDNGYAWYGYKWKNPPHGSVLLDGEKSMTEEQALEWLKSKINEN